LICFEGLGEDSDASMFIFYFMSYNGVIEWVDGVQVQVKSCVLVCTLFFLAGDIIIAWLLHEV
jgi:hypothetical protein